ncbi:Uncharacterised protein [uncultured archaeon]|nr:Uncharacterised protein [uncultured archaeon]
MEKELLEKHYNKNSKIRINLKSGQFYRGEISELKENSLIFLDKFENEILISLDSIAYVIPFREIKGNVNGDAKHGEKNK